MQTKQPSHQGWLTPAGLGHFVDPSSHKATPDKTVGRWSGRVRPSSSRVRDYAVTSRRGNGGSRWRGWRPRRGICSRGRGESGRALFTASKVYSQGLTLRPFLHTPSAVHNTPPCRMSVSESLRTVIAQPSRTSQPQAAVVSVRQVTPPTFDQLAARMRQSSTSDLAANRRRDRSCSLE